MARGDDDHDNTALTVALVGGGVLIVWLLLRGRGGHGLGGRAGGTGSGPTATAQTAPCRVRVGADGIDLDGAPADLATTVARCGSAGAAELIATGAATGRQIGNVIDALQSAGVVVRASPDVWDAIPAETRPR